MSAKPLVSVCVITYNQEAYIAETLDAILKQQINFPLQIVVADDCSKDNTRAIVRDYSDRHPGIFKLVFQEKNVGPGRNFVDLFNAADGKYIAYVEGDDFWTDARKLQKQFDFLEQHPDFSICYHRARLQWEYDSPEIATSDPETNQGDKPVSTIYDILKDGWFIRSCTLFMKNLRLPKGFEKLYIGDYPLHVLLADTGKIGFIDECMAVYRIHKKGKSETVLLSAELQQQKKNFRNHIRMLDFLNEQTAFKYKRYFEQNKFNMVYSHCSLFLKKSKPAFLSELFYILKNFGLGFIATNLINRRSKMA